MEKIALTAGKLSVKAALAGLFQDQLVYLYRDDNTMLNYFHFPVEKSNLALCILVRKHGCGEALKILRRAAGKDFDAAVFRERIAGMEKNGYALEKSDHGCNLAFPVERGGEIFGLSFFQLQRNDRRISNLIIQCALLRNDLENT